MPTIRESIQSLRGLLEQPVQRGSAPGTAPVQTPAPAKEPKKPEKGKKKTRFRVSKNGEGEVTEGASYPEIAGRIRAKTIEFYGEVYRQMDALERDYEALLRHRDQLDPEDAEDMQTHFNLLREVHTAVAHLRKSFDE